MKAEATSHAQKGRISSGIAKAARAASLHEAMYLRLSILRGHESTYKQDMGTWFEGVLLDLVSVGGYFVSRSTEETWYFNPSGMEQIQFGV